MKKILFLLLLFLSAYGCEKNDSKNETSKTVLTGKWTWISTCSGLGTGTDCYTPESMHKTEFLVFTTDSVFKSYVNDTLQATSPYHTFTAVTEDGLYTNHFIDYESIVTGPDWYTISNDTLTMRNVLGALLWTNRYKKAKI
jgi:hypothetical protein